MFLKKKYAEEEGDKRDRDEPPVESPSVLKKLKGGESSGARSSSPVGEDEQVVFKKKWSAQDGAFHEPEQKKTVVNTALNEWAQRERITKENKQRMENMKLRAKLLGFNYVEQNKFLIDREPVQVPLEEQDACECVYKDLKCSDNRCVNRGAMTECFPEKCEVTKCANQRFQKKEWIDFSLVYRGMMGYGVRTEQDVRKGDFIMEYVGDIIDEDEKTERQQREGVRHHYTMLLNPGEYIDPSLQGNFGRFLNHSCDPNCETQKWMVLGESRMGFFAKRDIPRGTDLTFDYQFERSGNVAQKCLCGASNCRGWIGAKKEKKKKDVKKEMDVADEESDDNSGSIEEGDNEMPDDPLGLEYEGNYVRPWAELSSALIDKARQMDASLFLVTADLIGPMMRSSKRDMAPNGRAVVRRLFLPRCIRRGFLMFYRLMDVSVPASAILEAMNTHKSYVPRKKYVCSSGTRESKRQEVEKLTSAARGKDPEAATNASVKIESPPPPPSPPHPPATEVKVEDVAVDVKAEN